MTIRAFLLLLLLAAVGFQGGVIAQQQDGDETGAEKPAEKPATEEQEEPKDPTARIKARAAADASRLLPQEGLGGDNTARVSPNKTTFTEIAIECEGCERMTGYMALPQGLEKGRKYALMFVFHGNGDVGRNRVRNVARITTARDPIITIGVQYQELEKNGKGKMGNRTLTGSDKIIEGSRWLLDKIMREQPVDPDRVFVGGFSWGTSWASGWCNREWKADAAKFPFRACFLYSSSGGGRKGTVPPIPVIATVGEKETAVLGRINVVRSVSRYCNVLASWGVPCQFHEIPKMGHSVNGRCHQITRDTINDLGGPGRVPYPSIKGEESPGADTLPFVTEDPYVQELINLCRDDRWQAALDRLAELVADRSIKSRLKRAAKKFPKEMARFAKKELPRLETLLDDCLQREVMPNPFQMRRMKSLSQAYATETWVARRKYAEKLRRLETNFPPTIREAEREAMIREAVQLERKEGGRADAKKKYEELAARKEEDGGRSVWPRAAAYRLTWWQDLE